MANRGPFRLRDWKLTRKILLRSGTIALLAGLTGCAAKQVEERDIDAIPAGKKTRTRPPAGLTDGIQAQLGILGWIKACLTKMSELSADNPAYAPQPTTPAVSGSDTSQHDPANQTARPQPGPDLANLTALFSSLEKMHRTHLDFLITNDPTKSQHDLISDEITDLTQVEGQLVEKETQLSEVLLELVDKTQLGWLKTSLVSMAAASKITATTKTAPSSVELTPNPKATVPDKIDSWQILLSQIHQYEYFLLTGIGLTKTNSAVFEQGLARKKTLLQTKQKVLAIINGFNTISTPVQPVYDSQIKLADDQSIMSCWIQQENRLLAAWIGPCVTDSTNKNYAFNQMIESGLQLIQLGGNPNWWPGWI